VIIKEEAYHWADINYTSTRLYLCGKFIPWHTSNRTLYSNEVSCDHRCFTLYNIYGIFVRHLAHIKSNET